MNITQILQIADWSITNTGNSFIESTGITGQIKFVNLGNTIAHFNKNTDEVLAVITQTKEYVLVYAVDTVIDQVVHTYTQIKENTLSAKLIDILSEQEIITELNSQYNREPDSMLEIDGMDGMTLAMIDDLADQAGLTRNGYMIKIICEQCERMIAEHDALSA